MVRSRIVISADPFHAFGSGRREGRATKNRRVIDFKTLQRPPSPNTYLACDPDDSPATADRPALRCVAEPAAVRDALLAVVRSAPRVEETGADAATMTFGFIQKSRLMRFVDDITIRVEPDGEGGARVLAYSASRVGWGDLGVNRKRIEGWFSALEAGLADAPSAT